MDNTYTKFNNSFAVQLPTESQDPTGIYKSALVSKILNKYPELTVTGLDAPFITPSGRNFKGIQYAGPSDLITFGTSKNHDVNWYKNSAYLNRFGSEPVYDIVKEWPKVISKLDSYAKEKENKNSCNCSYCNKRYNNPVYIEDKKVEIFDNFIKVGCTIIPRVASYKTFSNYNSVEMEMISEVILKVKYLY